MKKLFYFVAIFGLTLLNSCSSNDSTEQLVEENPTENPTALAVKFNIGGATTINGGEFKSFLNDSATPTAQTLRFDAKRGDSVKIITSYGQTNDTYPYFVTKGLDTIQSGTLKAVLRTTPTFNSIYKLVDVTTNSEVIEIN